MKKILKNFNVYDSIMIIFALILIVVQVWLDLKLPEYMMKITSLLKTEGTTIKTIWNEGFEMLLCSLGSAGSAILVSFLTARISSGFSMRLRANIFSKVESFSLEQIKRFSTASLITRTTNDVMQVQMLISMGMQVLIKAPIMAIWAILKMSHTNWQCSIATGIAVVVFVLKNNSSKATSSGLNVSISSHAA